jgi:RNA polymerase sigma-70 factor (ECF subfamily)
VQETFTQALANLSSAHADVRGWFIQHAHLACRRHDWSYRRYMRAAYASRDACQRQEPTSEAPASEHEARATPVRLGRLTLVHALARLLPDQRRCVQLRYLDGMPRDMAADVLGRTTNAARLLERRALRRLAALALAE